MKILHKRLATYSAFASGLINANTAFGESIYNNIEPDTILECYFTEGFDIDIDLNGTIDIEFLNNSFTFFTYFNQFANAYPEELSIAGSIGYFYENYPFAISEGELIDSNLDFSDNFIQILAGKFFHTDWYFYYVFTYGNWYPEQHDKYLGIRFDDADSCTHYGWIRCDVLDEGRQLVIKDYAYESKCNTAILAGDTVGFISPLVMDTSIHIHTDINESELLLNAEVYSFNGDIFINIGDNKGGYSVALFNLDGQQLFLQKYQQPQITIRPNLIHGIYLIEIKSGNHSLMKKIYV